MWMKSESASLCTLKVFFILQNICHWEEGRGRNPDRGSNTDSVCKWGREWKLFWSFTELSSFVLFWVKHHHPHIHILTFSNILFQNILLKSQSFPLFRIQSSLPSFIPSFLCKIFSLLLHLPLSPSLPSIVSWVVNRMVRLRTVTYGDFYSHSLCLWSSFLLNFLPSVFLFFPPSSSSFFIQKSIIKLPSSSHWEEKLSFFNSECSARSW